MRTIYLRLFLAFGVGASAILAASTAEARYAGSISCFGGRHMRSCVFVGGQVGNPHVQSVQPNEGSERDEAWLRRCRPVIVTDRYGMPRYRYSAEGCEYGD